MIKQIIYYLHLLKDNTLGHARTTHRVGLHRCKRVRLVVMLGGPSGVSVLNSKLTTGSDTTWLSAKIYTKKNVNE